jgi:hypothetical protein
MLAGSYVIATNAPLICDSFSRNKLSCLMPPVRVFFERRYDAGLDEIRVRYGFRRGAECRINNTFDVAAVFNTKIDICRDSQIEGSYRCPRLINI